MRVPLDKIVREYMVESLGLSAIDNRYPRLLQIAINGLRDLHFDRKSANKFVVLPIEDNDTAILPNDFISYARIGVCFNGSVLAMGANDNMCPPHTNDCGDTVIDQPRHGDNLGFGWNNGLTNYGYPLYQNYGVGGGQNGIGYYKIYPDKGFIAFQSVNTHFDEIILEYVGDIDSIDGEYLVHSFDVEPIKAWMYWKSNQRLDKALSQKEEARIQYGREKRKAFERHNRIPLNEWMQMFRQGYKSSPKL